MSVRSRQAWAVVVLSSLYLSANDSMAAEKGPLVGKPLPRLELSHALQGSAWNQDQLLGTVVVLAFFQRG